MGGLNTKLAPAAKQFQALVAASLTGSVLVTEGHRPPANRPQRSLERGAA